MSFVHISRRLDTGHPLSPVVEPVGFPPRRPVSKIGRFFVEITRSLSQKSWMQNDCKEKQALVCVCVCVCVRVCVVQKWRDGTATKLLDRNKRYVLFCICVWDLPGRAISKLSKTIVQVSWRSWSIGFCHNTGSIGLEQLIQGHWW